MADRVTVVDAITQTLKRRSEPTDIETVFKRVREITGRKIARITVAAQLARNTKLYKRSGHGLYSLKKAAA